MKNRNKRGFSLLELTVVMAVLGILLAAGLYGFNQYIKNAQGSACTQVLADLNRAQATCVTLYNVTSQSDITPACMGTTMSNGITSAPGGYAAYLGGKSLVGDGCGDGTLRCPGTGTIVKSSTFQPTTTILNPPTCTEGLSPQYAGTTLHQVK